MMPKNTPKKAYITLELAPKLKTACERAAKADGNRSLANWLRMTLKRATTNRS